MVTKGRKFSPFFIQKINLDVLRLNHGVDIFRNFWYIYTRVKGTHGVKNKQGT